MRPHERLLSVLAESLNAAGFEATVDDSDLYVNGVRFPCSELNRKASVAFNGDIYYFRGQTMNPTAEHAVRRLIAVLGARLEVRRRREEVRRRREELEAATRSAAEARAATERERKQLYEERCEAVARIAQQNLGGGFYELVPGLRAQVTDTLYRLEYDNADFGTLMIAADFIQELR